MSTNSEKKKGKSRFSAKAILLHSLRVVAFFTLIVVCGFFVFAYSITVMPPSPLREADGIVALTGDEVRIQEAVRLLANGKAKRLLISGVYPTTNKPEIISLNTTGQGDASLFRCCVDLDKRALNTEDNAFETTVWVRQRGFRSLIVVTSDYHMPRSLVELRQSMPDVELIPYPVRSRRPDTSWRTHPRTVWVLAKEYMKFITALARYAANTVTGDAEKMETHSLMVDARAG
jgi:uncharacterized SAM-binding protein YcdF (DUF218 family)